ncbi:methylmalonyl-CoA mutase family protein [Nocardioides donggukensis]|uniref:Methylmalonyl-CoA mutase n=1 Tax=Nocardioides donggukensis TaxID=2774019 RepID=A0A927K4D3_9ACTN|nr:methylmalonyl-CoA mutase family protein [Nocardioides donggukensis]MBD8868658.1 methylmalonyl-CoA mutase [Nocardioides donggukensis]
MTSPGSADDAVEGGLDEPTELEPEQGSLALATEHDRWTRPDWERAAAAVLRKARRMSEDDPDSDVWRELTLRTLDDIEVAPLGTPESVEGLAATGAPGAAPYTRGRLPERPETGWDIRPVFSGPDPRGTAEAVLVDLENGATSVWLDLGQGLPPEQLGAVLESVFVDLAPVVLTAPADPAGAARALLAVLEERGVEPAEGTNLGADPIGAQVRGGLESLAGTRASTTEADEALVEVARLARDAGTLGVVVDGTALHDLGASDAQELGYTLAVGAAYLRTLTAAGLGMEEALGLIEFRYAATAEQFPTIAKLRAARRAWARVAELGGAAPEHRAQRQHAVTSRPMMAKYDAWVNMLRTTVAAFAAGVGGADAVTVLPFDTALGAPDAFARRIARNTSSLLVSESHVARVADPAGGSFAVERLTDDLARASWEELDRIEAAGGIRAALADGSVRTRVEEVSARRESEIAHRTRPLTGISEFPHLGETLPERAPWPVEDRVRRYGASFEALRDDPADRAVFLATMGPVAAHTARATYATNLLAAGGVAVEAAGPTDGADAVLAAYDGQPVVCLAGTDATYAEWGAELVAALRAAGARHVVLAGRPRDLEVDDSCAVGVDALRFLHTTREKLA